MFLHDVIVVEEPLAGGPNIYLVVEVPVQALMRAGEDAAGCIEAREQARLPPLRSAVGNTLAASELPRTGSEVISTEQLTTDGSGEQVLGVPDFATCAAAGKEWCFQILPGMGMRLLASARFDPLLWEVSESANPCHPFQHRFEPRITRFHSGCHAGTEYHIADFRVRIGDDQSHQCASSDGSQRELVQC